MPGNDAPQPPDSFREARKRGKVKEYREANRTSEPDVTESSQDKYLNAAEPGDVLVAKQLRSRSEFKSLAIHVWGRVPRNYEVEITLQRGTSSFEQHDPISEGQNEITDLDFLTEFRSGDILIVRLQSTSNQETQQIGPLISTITTVHA